MGHLVVSDGLVTISAANLTWITAAVSGDLRRAGELHERSRSLAERIGAVGFIRWQQGEHVFHCHWQGRWEEALVAAEDFIRDAEAWPSHYMGSACRCIRAAIRFARGDIEAALADAHSATELARPTKDPQSLNPALAIEARVRLATGDQVAANALADELVAAWRSTGIRQPHECTDAGWVFSELERADELRAALEQVSGRTPWHEAARHIVSGDLVAAADTYARIGSVPDEAYARLRAAEELVRSEQRTEADRQLRLALPVFVQLRASAWQAEAQTLLAASA